MPDAAKGTDAASAEAFVKFYWEMVNYAQRTGNIERLIAIADRCVNCDNGVQSIRDTYQAEGVIRGGIGSVAQLDTTFLDRPDGDWAVVEYRLHTTEQEIDLPGQEDDKQFPGGSTDLRMILEPISDGWLVRSLVTR